MSRRVACASDTMIRSKDKEIRTGARATGLCDLREGGLVRTSLRTGPFYLCNLHNFVGTTLCIFHKRGEESPTLSRI